MLQFNGTRAPRARAFCGLIALLVVLATVPAFGAIPQIEREALLALYNSTNGAGWKNKSNWNGAAGTECNWFGVACNGGQTAVLSLLLPSNQLSGAIPAELGNLGSLQMLTLHFNQLSGAIPAELGSLSNLRGLYLTSNQLTGAIPAELGNLSSLRDLWLSSNQLSGAIPAELGNLSSLLVLRLGINQLSGAIPAELGNLGSLQDLYLGFSQLSGAIPAELGNLSSLQVLDLNGNQMSGPIPAELGNLSSLRILGLSTNQLSGAIPAELGNLISLQRLVLYSNQMSGPIPTELANLSSLQELTLHNNQLSGAIPAELGNLSSLKDLSLGGNRLSGAIPAELGNLTSLQGLYLYFNRLSGTIPAELGNLSSLKTLNLSFNQLSGAIPASLASLTAVSGLNLAYNGLSAADPGVGAWANARQASWASTQTVAPADVAVSSVTSTTATLSWTPIAYTGNTGRYEAWLSAGAGAALAGSTPNKSATGITVTGLLADTTYTFTVRTVTTPHTNSNTVTSVFSAEVIAATACTAVGVTTEPQSQTISAGAAANLSVNVSGTGPFEYRWFHGTSGDTSNPVQGPTSSSSTSSAFNTGTLTTTTSYWVRIRNCSNNSTVNSATATVTMIDTCTAPSVTSQPASSTIEIGDRATLAIVAAGTDLQYQWYKGEAPRTLEPVRGNGPKLTTSPLVQSMSYWVRVSNACGDADSGTATVTVLPCPSGVPCAVTRYVRLLPGHGLTVANPQSVQVTGRLRVLARSLPHGSSTPFTLAPGATVTLQPVAGIPSIVAIDTDNVVNVAGSLPIAYAGRSVLVPFSYAPVSTAGTLLVAYGGGDTRVKVYETPQSGAPLRSMTLFDQGQTAVSAYQFAALPPGGMAVRDGVIRLEPITGYAVLATDVVAGRRRAVRHPGVETPVVTLETGAVVEFTSGNRISAPALPGTTYRWILHNAFPEGAVNSNVLTFTAGTAGFATVVLEATANGVTTGTEVNLRVAAAH